jgi:hypothetical protein
MNERFRHARKFIENVLARDTNLSVFPERDLQVASTFAKQRAWKKSGDGMVWTVKRRERRAPERGLSQSAAGGQAGTRSE